MASRTKQFELVAALLETESTLALATTDEDGRAAVAPLFYLAEGLCLYWISATTTEHSENLKRDPTSSVTIYRPTDNWKDIRGVQMRGCVFPVKNGKRRKELIGLYSDRFRLGVNFQPTIARRTLYTFRPNFVRYIDNSQRFGYKFDLIFTVDEEAC